MSGLRKGPISTTTADDSAQAAASRSWQLISECDDERESRRAELDWRPQEDRAIRATVGGIAPPGSASTAASKTSRVAAAASMRVASSNPAMTAAARWRLLFRVLLVALIASGYYWFAYVPN